MANEVAQKEIEQKKAEGRKAVKVTVEFDDGTSVAVEQEPETACIVQFTKNEPEKNGTSTIQLGWTQCGANMLIHSVLNLTEIVQTMLKSL